MVDHVVGGVGGGVLLDSDLGDVVDLVVDLVANLVDNRSCGNMDGWSSNMVVGNRGHGNSRGSLDLNSLDSSNSWSSNMVGSSRGNSNGGSRGNMIGCRGNSNGGSWGNVMIGNRSNNGGSYGDNRGSVSNRINKPILVHIFRESLQ